MCIDVNQATVPGIVSPNLLVVAKARTTQDQRQPTQVKSTHRGLCWDRKHNAWRVRIFYQGKQRHVGRFKDDTQAARAYDKAAYFLYGAKAILNFSVEEVLADTSEVPAFIRLAKEQAAAGASTSSSSSRGEPVAMLSTNSGSSSPYSSSPMPHMLSYSSAATGPVSSGQQPWLSQQQPQGQPVLLNAAGGLPCSSSYDAQASYMSLPQNQQQLALMHQQLLAANAPGLLHQGSHEQSTWPMSYPIPAGAAAYSSTSASAGTFETLSHGCSSGRVQACLPLQTTPQLRPSAGQLGLQLHSIQALDVHDRHTRHQPQLLGRGFEQQQSTLIRHMSGITPAGQGSLMGAGSLSAAPAVPSIALQQAPDSSRGVYMLSVPHMQQQVHAQGQLLQLVAQQPSCNVGQQLLPQQQQALTAGVAGMPGAAHLQVQPAPSRLSLTAPMSSCDILSSSNAYAPVALQLPHLPNAAVLQQRSPQMLPQQQPQQQSFLMFQEQQPAVAMSAALPPTTILAGMLQDCSI